MALSMLHLSPAAWNDLYKSTNDRGWKNGSDVVLQEDRNGSFNIVSFVENFCVAVIVLKSFNDTLTVLTHYVVLRLDVLPYDG